VRAEKQDVGGRATGDGDEVRRRRLAAALRENLKRRKTQARGRSVADVPAAAAIPAAVGDRAPGEGPAEAGRATDEAPVSQAAAVAAAVRHPSADEDCAGPPDTAAGPVGADGPTLPGRQSSGTESTGNSRGEDAPGADGTVEDETDGDVTWRVRLVAAELEAERIAALIERAVEADGWPVTRYELPPAAAGDGTATAGTATARTAASGVGTAVEAGAGAPAFAARLVRDEEWPWAVEVLVFGGTAAAARARILDAVGGDGFGSMITVEPLEAEDWVAKSLEGLPPVREGRFLVRGRHARGSEPAGIVAIDIEAGLAFGTGHHATTVGCLAAIERALARRRPRRPLDLGTGTGVLAIAIARLAKVAVVASDIDPVAVRVAAANARANGVGPWVRPFGATGLADRRLSAGGFDLVVANILARPLERLAPSIGRSLAPRATVILSGLRVPDGRRVEAAYRRQGLVLTRRDPRDGWLTLTFERR
jgi:ribosomal protein L11 methyltransferase